jgi:hypothetical protein
MIELMGLALCNSAINWGLSPVSATRTVAADPATLKALVADHITAGRLVDGTSPLLCPNARVEASRHPRFVHAMVSVGGRDALRMSWIFTPRQGTTEVDLIAQLESRSLLVRCAMLLGGERWLRTRLERSLTAVAALAHRTAEDRVDASQRQAARPARARRRHEPPARPSRRRHVDLARHPLARSFSAAGPSPRRSRAAR